MTVETSRVLDTDYAILTSNFSMLVLWMSRYVQFISAQMTFSKFNSILHLGSAAGGRASEAHLVVNASSTVQGGSAYSDIQPIALFFLSNNLVTHAQNPTKLLALTLVMLLQLLLQKAIL